MKDYYKILDINNTEDDLSAKQIKDAYNVQISRFVGLPFLTKMMIQDIKNIKEAYYVLSSETMKNKYDKIFKKHKQLEEDARQVDNTKICNRLFSITFT